MDDAMRARFEEAHAEARRMTAQLHGATGHVNGYATTPADIAAHIVARAVAGRKGPVAPAVWRMFNQALEIATKLQPLVDNPLPMGGESGKNGVTWSIAGAFVHIAGEGHYMSAVSPGLHEHLPDIPTDDEALLGIYREHLRVAGIRPDLIDGATVTTKRTRHGAWTRFAVPMDDARLTSQGEIMNAVHMARVKIDDSLSAYARAAVHVQDNHASLVRLADNAQRDAQTKAAGIAGIRIGKVHLHSIGFYKSDASGQRVTLYVPVTTLTPGLLPGIQNAIYTSELGLSVFTDVGIDTVFEAHARRAAMLNRHGGARADATGMAVLRSLGHDVDAMVRAARAIGHAVVNAARTDHVEVEEGRVVASATLSDRIKWHKDHISVPDAIPETLMQALIGRPARAAVDHPAFEGAVITKVKRKGGRTHIHLQPRWEVLP